MVIRLLLCCGVVVLTQLATTPLAFPAMVTVELGPWQENGNVTNSASNTSSIAEFAISFDEPFAGNATWDRVVPGSVAEDFIEGQNRYFQTIRFVELSIPPGESFQFDNLDHDSIESLEPLNVLQAVGGSLATASVSAMFADGATVAAPLIDQFAGLSQAVELPAPLDPLIGDTFPLDGVINLEDINNVRNHFGDGEITGPPIPGDTYPFDGKVDLGDLNRVRNFFGASRLTTTAVPEPSGFLLAFIALALFYREPVRFAIRRPAR